MIAFLLVLAAVGCVMWLLQHHQPVSSNKRVPKISPELRQLSDHADRLYREKRWVAAEKAYLKVLTLDHRHVVAYSHLGVIYSTQKNTIDAIECFQMAAQIKPSAGTFHNLAIGFYENRNYIKASAAFEKSIMFEPSAPRYIGLSKAKRQLQDTAAMIMALERAVALDTSPRVVSLLEDAYRVAKRPHDADALRAGQLRHRELPKTELSE